MAKKAGTGMQLLGIAGGVATMIVAGHFPIPLAALGAHSTTLLSLIALLLGIIIGPARAATIAFLYVLALILDVPGLIWHSQDAAEPFLGVPVNGLAVGLIFAALVAGMLTPTGTNSSNTRIAIAILAGHLAYLIVGIAWLARFGPLPRAAEVMLATQGVAICLKSAVAFLIAITAGTYVRR